MAGGEMLGNASGRRGCGPRGCQPWAGGCRVEGERVGTLPCSPCLGCEPLALQLGSHFFLGQHLLEGSSSCWLWGHCLLPLLLQEWNRLLHVPG